MHHKDVPVFQSIENIVLLCFLSEGYRSSKTNFFETGFAYADQALLEVLEFPVINGDPKQALTNRNSIVITKKIADKFFPNEEAVGNSLVLNNNERNPYIITAVIDNFPDNSHMDFNFLMMLYPICLVRKPAGIVIIITIICW